MASSSIWPEHSIDNRKVDSSNLSSPTISLSTKQTGDISEMKFVTWCLEQGLGVSMPIGDRLPYDVIVDINGRLIKAQVKTGWRRNSNSLSIAASNTTTENGQWAYRSYVSKADVIIAYDPLSKLLYCLPSDKLGSVRKEFQLRLAPAKNNQVLGVWFAQDYELKSVSQLV